MAVLPVVILGDPALHAPTEPVTESPEELRGLVADLYETIDYSAYNDFDADIFNFSQEGHQ